jgi:hypothetical protein
VFLVVHSATCVLFSRFASPFIFVPTLVGAVMIAATNRRWVRTRPWFVAAWAIGVAVAPFAAEATGVFRSTWRASGDGLLINSDALATTSPLPLVIANVAFVVVLARYALGINRDRHDARRAADIAGWQLRQLVPPSRRDVRSRDG